MEFSSQEASLCCVRTETHESVLVDGVRDVEMAPPGSAQLLAVVTRAQKSCLEGISFSL